MIRCGNKEHNEPTWHDTIDDVRECYDRRYHEEWVAAQERDAEEAYVRYLEDKGYDDARAQEAYDSQFT